MAVDKSLTIKELTQMLHDRGVNRVEQAKLLGVSPLQAHLYRTGKTQNAGVKVALSAYRHITIDGQSVVLSPYLGRQDILDKVKCYEEQAAQTVRDCGYGNLDITTPST